MNFGEFLKELRSQRKVTQRELAEKVGVDYTYISHVERGQLKPPSEQTIIKMADALKMDKDVMLAAAGKISADIIEYLIDNPGKIKAIRKWMKKRE